jgi:hypothetical protein
MLFDKLDVGTYVYKIEAEDESGKVYPLVGVSFMVTQQLESGDLNGDGGITISDGVILQRYILGCERLTPEQHESADLTSDATVDIFDMIMFRKALIGEK